ncbi:MAG: ATP-binding cassette domain-containing protein [Anaerolineaceae bacterium]|nr:ATP-binding cassette domain-containing protein [Anaerolineaceae bacterium]
MLISLDNITLRINGHRLLENTTWTIHKGQNWAIIGPTGSGKTLLARAIGHQIPVVQGSVQHFFAQPDPALGRTKNILTLSTHTHQQFMQRFSTYHQARWQSIERDESPIVANLLTANSIVQVSPYEIDPPLPDPQRFAKKQAEVISLLKLTPLLPKHIHLLSHGESRKVFIARLLLQSPQLLILDDPLIGLDPQSRATLAAGITDLIRQQAVQVLFITTRADEIPPDIRHLLVMQDGHIAAQGARMQLLNDPKLQNLVSPPPASRQAYKGNAAFDAMIASYADDSSPTPAALVEMQNVSVRYGQTGILHNINWTVRQGECWALLGHNGAGKSTLLSLILADNPQAYANHISLFGKRRGSGESIWEIKRRIGWVSPELHIYFRKTVTCLDAVCSGFYDSNGLYHSCTADQTAASHNWLQILDMASLAEVPFNALSTGQQRLILLARALVNNPPLLILDEPCQGLDESHRRVFLDLLDQLCEGTNLSLIYVTHYADELPASIDHHLRLKQGCVI